MLRQFHQEGLLLWFKRTAAWLFGTFGALALFLAVVGVYGVRSYVTARRTREFGIRMALGAGASDVLWMVLREGFVLTGTGIGLGLLLASAASLVLRSFLYGLGAVDPFSVGIATLSLTITTLAACYIPARRATRTQPMAALRCE
jgi:ABC-type antimicrobial peptide transport system permease subunit